jgi:hypothetical protein
MGPGERRCDRCGNTFTPPRTSPFALRCLSCPAVRAPKKLEHLTDGSPCWCDPETVAGVVIHRQEQ